MQICAEVERISFLNVFYMALNKYFFYILLAILFSSCAAPLNIDYFQDAAQVQGILGLEKQFLRLKPDDKINIIVHSADPMLASQFSLKAGGNQTLGATVSPQTTASGGGGGSQIVAYTVDEQGDIAFPILGKISVIGKTRNEVADYIAQRLRERELVTDALVTVEYVNMGIDVLGEVKNPGHVDIKKDYFTLLDAIAAVGDLTIEGRRDRVLVLRTQDHEEYSYEVDLCSKADLYYSPVFYLQQNDIVYVAPNAKRKREANPNGNTFNTPGFWVSMASFVMTLITFLSK